MKRLLIGCLVIFAGMNLGEARAFDARSVGELVSQADEALKLGDYDSALKAYDAAEKLLPDSQPVSFNRGVAYYRKGQFDKAAEMFSRAIAGPDRTLDGKSKFNLGDCAYSTALQKKDQPDAAMSQLKSAISFYREALE